jgi:hypothetical protein
MSDYDPRTCVTARELRGIGMTLAETIPDCAWVPRDSILYSDPEVVPGEPKAIAIGLKVTFTVPFQFIEVTFSIDEAKETPPT